jgi:threonine dehydratase
MNEIPSQHVIETSHERIKKYIHKTPILSSESINNIFNTKLFFKCENFQKAGAFKFRGAINSVLMLNEEERKFGVATHSSGNHAAALSLAAQMNNIPAFIVMPKNAPEIKKKAVNSYGGKITFCEPTLESRETTLNNLILNNNAEVIHPYNDYRVIAGQATCTKEIFEELEDLDYLITPVGGGGLLSGSLLATKYFSPSTKVIAAEPLNANDAYLSVKENRIVPSINPITIADGLRTTLGDKTFPIIKNYIDEIITVSEENIIKAMRLIWERMKIIIEPSSAVVLGVFYEKPELFINKNIALILSGGNVDLEKLPWN